MNKNNKRTIGEVLWLTFEFAKQDRMDMLTLLSPHDPERVSVEADLKAITHLQQRLFGTSDAPVQAVIQSMRPNSVLRLVLDGLKTSPEEEIK